MQAGKPKLWVALAFVAVIAIAAQFVRPSLGRPAGPQKAMAAPPEIQSIFERRCFACHSDSPQLVWFDQVAPAYWLVAYDVRRARMHLNFSELGNKPAVIQRATLFEAVNQIQLGAMPLPRYLAAHHGSTVTPEELATLKAYLAPFAPSAKSEQTPAQAEMSAPAAPGSVRPASPSLNGVPFMPGYQDWPLVSTTDRGDNNTLRIITGNPIAMQAISNRATNPWPDGAAFAKITMQSNDDGSGHVSAGKFTQVEFMEKDHAKYARTKGWGYARFRGNDLKPYGHDARFDNECVACHNPVRDNDYVYSLPIPHGGGAQ